jgi:hypothetical protein
MIELVLSTIPSCMKVKLVQSFPVDLLLELEAELELDSSDTASFRRFRIALESSVARLMPSMQSGAILWVSL